MPRVIWKFALESTDEQTIEMPESAEILCVQAQRDFPCLWARVDPEAPVGRRVIAIRGTGHDASTLVTASYIGTYQILGGDLVFHVFDRGWERQ